MRVLVFDWEEGGHHEGYVARFADGLGARAEVTVAAPSSVLSTLPESLDAERIDLGLARPEKGNLRTRPALDRRELTLFERAIREAEADHGFHLFADHLLPILALRRRSSVPTTLLLLRPRAHYAAGFGLKLSARDRVAGRLHEWLLARFRRRSDANAVFTLDPVAARAWSSRPGAPARWMPEPWVDPGPPPEAPRDGCVLYGYLSARKGLDRLALAVEHLEPGVRVVVAGVSSPEYVNELERLCTQMRANGARVERVGELDEVSAQAVLSSAEVAVLPYRRHIGMSRVLIEAATAGTPALADEFGLLGHLAKEWGLGDSVDTEDPRAFAAAIRRLAEAGPSEADLRERVDELTGETAFRAALAEAF